MKKITQILFIILLPLFSMAQTGKMKRIIFSKVQKEENIQTIRDYNHIYGNSDSKKIIVKVVDHVGNKIIVTKLDLESKEQKNDTIQIPIYSYFTYSNTEVLFSAVNIPFKLRLSQDTISSNVETDIKNFGFFIGPKKTINRYLYNGRESVHAFSGGVFFSPTAIELNSDNTNEKVKDEISSFGLSTGIGLSYTYNKVSFMLIPIGIDIGLLPQTKNWIYDKKIWFGFGFGIDLGLFK